MCFRNGFRSEIIIVGSDLMRGVRKLKHTRCVSDDLRDRDLSAARSTRVWHRRERGRRYETRVSEITPGRRKRK